MILKEGVTRQGVKEPIYYAIGIAHVLYIREGHQCVVTSLTDSHADRPDSLHNQGLAVDLRIRDLPANSKQTIASSLSLILEPMGYDVVLEADHLHIEWDPKGKEN